MMRVNPNRSAVEVIEAVARAHWRTVKAAWDREDPEAISAEVSQNCEDSGDGTTDRR
jgi:hypothetical protein